MENANSHPLKVEVVKDTKGMYANSHPYKVEIVGGGSGGYEAKVVDELPEEGEVGYIYLVLKESTSEGDIYDEYIWALQQDETYAWEHLGATNEVSIVLYGTTGTNTDGAMTQLATTSMIYADPATKEKIQIGYNANSADYRSLTIGVGSFAARSDIAIGTNAMARYQSAIAIGNSSYTATTASASIAFGSEAKVNGAYNNSVALGSYANVTSSGQVNIGTGSLNYGYNASPYRLLSGVYDPQSAHDAATKGYVDTAVASAGAPVITNSNFNNLWENA